MARPTKFRSVEFFPDDDYFIPEGKSKSETIDIILKIEELEAMRLKDIEGLNQEECAKKMNISRQTFQNIIDNARKNVAMALTEGKAIRIDGGNYTTKNCKIGCEDCKGVYEIKYEQDYSICPICSSQNIRCKKRLESCKRWCKISSY